ncbi:MAG: diguanylate cyclase [Clostridiales bacterium]|nr:diguanylate cyclase [Clostridiales bacterium]
MDRRSVEKILEKYGRIFYVGNDDRINELESIKKYTIDLGREYELYRLAILMAAKGKGTDTISYSKKGIEESIVSGNDYLAVEIYMFLGIHYRMKNQFDDAFRAYIGALKISPTARCYNNLADLYILIGALDEAQEFLSKALHLLESKEVLSEFEQRLLNIVYTNQSEVELLQGNLELAKSSGLSILEYSKENGDIFNQGYGLTVLGNICLIKKEYESAMNYLNEADLLYKSCDESSQRQVEAYIGEVLILQSKCLYEWGKYEESIDKINQLLLKDKHYYEYLIKNYEALDKKDEAYKIYQEFMTYIVTEEENKKAEQKENFKTTVEIYETEKKAHEYELLYSNTKSIGEIGRQIISADKLDHVLNAIHSHIDKIMDFNALALGVIEDGVIHFNWMFENNERLEPYETLVENKNSMSGWVARNKKAIRLNDALTRDELKKYKETPDMNWHGDTMDSMIVAPIMVKNEILGIISVQSSDKFQYSEYDLEVINTLASFIGVAMKNWQSKQALKEMNEKLEELSKTDALTGVSNRHILSEIVEDIFKKDLHDDHKISVVMIDIDHFKEYNDTYGHIDGDRCIIEIVNQLRVKLDTDGNRLFRYGGDEFAAIVPFMEEQLVFKMLEGIRSEIEALKIPNKKSKVSDFVTCSFGFTTVKKGEKNYQKAFYLADEALYKAKAKGKNQTVFIKD